MNRSDIDDILAGEDRIQPSPEFLASVMRAVHREAASLPPLEFPWMRALPVFLAAIVAVAAAIAHGVGLLGDASVMAVLDKQFGQITEVAAGFQLQWIALASAATIFSVMLSSRLVRGRDYA